MAALAQPAHEVAQLGPRPAPLPALLARRRLALARLALLARLAVALRLHLLLGALLERVLEDLHWAVPRSRGLAPIGHRAVKEKRATFRAVPGVDRIRPSVEPGIGVPNLFLAGDWCRSGWPATMEGAVRTGYAAAAAAVGGPGVMDDLPIARGARLLGLR